MWISSRHEMEVKVIAPDVLRMGTSGRSKSLVVHERSEDRRIATSDYVRRSLCHEATKWVPRPKMMQCLLLEVLWVSST